MVGPVSQPTDRLPTPIPNPGAAQQSGSGPGSCASPHRAGPHAQQSGPGRDSCAPRKEPTAVGRAAGAVHQPPAVRGVVDDAGMERPDEYVAWLARKQHGVFTTDQARAAGFSDDQVQRRVRRGQWIRLMRGVLGLNGVPPSLRRSTMAALLARTDGAASHLTAVTLLGSSFPTPMRPTITAPPGSSSRSPLALVHRLPLPAHLVTTIDGIPCTRADRTLVDCAAVLGPKRHGDLIDDVLHRKLTTAQAVLDLLGRTAHLTVTRKQAVAAQLEVWLPAIRPGSAAEARLLRQVEAWGLPTPKRQVQIRDRDGQVIARVDGGWPERRVGFEYDSVQWHGPAAWASDEARHDLVTALGWQLLHVDKSDLVPGATSGRDRLLAAYHRRPVLPSRAALPQQRAAVRSSG